MQRVGFVKVCRGGLQRHAGRLQRYGGVGFVKICRGRVTKVCRKVAKGGVCEGVQGSGCKGTQEGCKGMEGWGL